MNTLYKKICTLFQSGTDKEENMKKRKSRITKIKPPAPKQLSKSEMSKKLAVIFNRDSRKLFNYKQLASKLGVNSTQQKQMIIDILDDLTYHGYLLEPTRGKFKLREPDRGSCVEGRLERKHGGKIFLVPEDGGEEVFIVEKNMNKAIVGDMVRVCLFARRKNQMQEGEVLEVLERRHNTFVGILQVLDDYAFVQVDSRLIGRDIFVPKEGLNGGSTGDKVVARILDWAERERNPIGEVVDVLGITGENNTEMNAILADYGLPYRYPEDVENYANTIPDEIPADEIARRIDCRETVTFTIDPRDAKDFDDALSIRSLENGHWEVGIHIADVTHYVKPDDLIDQEAVRRATSVYLVDRTIPMLPERLSNQLCSLRPDEEKLCYSVIFEMDDQANVLGYNIVHTVIKSNRRFTYEEAQEILDTGQGDFYAELSTFNRLAQQLRLRRFKKGAIAFERIEVGFEIDETGKPLSVIFKEAKETHKLIEEFMLLANETVAMHIGKPVGRSKSKVFVYRIHAEPDPEKLANFAQFISRFGYKLNIEGNPAEVSAAINRLLDKVQGTKEQNLIETIAIRSMAKAIYSTVNIGHYGLAFDYYTHFTSPIRRYPDMMAHRLLDHYAAGNGSVVQDDYERLCKHCSDIEQIAASAERSSIKYKQVEFMSDKVGQVYDGVISGIQDWGIYVELAGNKCEGMIPIRSLDDDYYTFDEKNYRLVGRNYNRSYRLGEEVTVSISRTSLEKKQLDLELISKKR